MPLADYQISYRGETWGASQNVDLLKIGGLFDESTRTADRDFPRSHGGVAGLHLLGQKTFILEMEIRQGSPIRILIAYHKGIYLIANSIEDLLPLSFTSDYLKEQISGL